MIKAPAISGTTGWGGWLYHTNAKQKDSTQYSYTKYDIIGRITEVRQLVSGTAMADAISRSQDSLNQWLTNAAPTAEQITKTKYELEYTLLQPGKY